MQSGVPIAAPSANKSGYLSATSHEHVKNGFKDDEIFIIDSENTTLYGLESTIIDLSTAIPTILRFGFITKQVIEQIIGKEVAIATKSSAIKAPGMMHLHYAPATPVRIPSGDLSEAAANLFAHLHILDSYAKKNSIKKIAVAKIPNESIGLAINDRLTRAVHR